MTIAILYALDIKIVYRLRVRVRLGTRLLYILSFDSMSNAAVQSRPKFQKKMKKGAKETSLLAVDPAEIAIPADGDDVGKEHAVLQREKGKVDGLDKRPDHPVGLESGPPGLLEALRGRGALHGGHAAEEDANHGGGKDGLVNEDAGEDFGALVGKGDAAGEKVEPGSGGRSKYGFLLFLCNVSNLGPCWLKRLQIRLKGVNSPPP